MMIGDNDTIILRFKSLGTDPNPSLLSGRGDLSPSPFQGEGRGEGEGIG